MSDNKIEVKKYSYRQTKDGSIIGLVLPPHDLNAVLSVAPIGTRFELTYRMLSDDE